MPRVYQSFEQLPAGLETIVTIGKFDGVHLGHREVINRLLSLATELELEPVVITFDRNPQQFFRPEEADPCLSSVSEKVELLSQTGVSNILVLEFGSKLAELSAEQFLEQLLVSAGAKAILVGRDFRFGKSGLGSLKTLQDQAQLRGFQVFTVEDIQLEGERISSTKIRKALAAGEVAEAAKLLGRFPKLSGEVVHGAKRGRELGFPTANLSQDYSGVAPADGVYAGYLWLDNVRHPAAISVGTNPTFSGVLNRQVEAHVLDENFDIYGRQIEIEFVSKVRAMEAFSSVEELIATMHNDLVQVRKVLSEHMS